jgi:hypothetical protein
VTLESHRRRLPATPIVAATNADVRRGADAGDAAV